MTKIANHLAVTVPYPSRNCVESIHWAGTVLFHRYGDSQDLGFRIIFSTVSFPIDDNHTV